MIAEDLLCVGYVRSAHGARAYASGGGIGVGALSVPPHLSNVKQELPPNSTLLAYDAPTFPPNFQLAPGSTEDTEVILDIDMVLAMAPQANIIVYEVNQLSPAFNGSSFVSLLAAIADDDRAQTVSSSWPWTVSTLGEPSVVWNVLSQFAAQDQSFFISAGDQGSLIQNDPYSTAFQSPQSPTVQEPIIDSEFMTVVGGTELQTGGNGLRSGETTWNDTDNARTINGTAQNTVTTGGFCTGSSPNPANGPVGPAFPALPLPVWQSNVSQNNTEVNANPLQARMIPDVSMVADGIASVCSNCGFPGDALCQEGTSAGAPLWAAFIALVNQANGFTEKGPSPAPIGFVNPMLYSHAANFNDIADNSNNNWFDDGQVTEVGTVPGAIPPMISAPYAQVTTASGNLSNSPLPGAADAGASESPGLYHAVTGYDLATGLGTPTCGLFASLAPNFSAPGSDAGSGGDAADSAAASGGVTITYHQVGECEGFPEDTDNSEAGGGFAFVIFGIDRIDNTATSPFNFNPGGPSNAEPGNLFVPPVEFVFQNADSLASCSNMTMASTVNCPTVSFPTPYPTPMTVAAGMNIPFMGAPATNDAGLDAGGPLPTQFVMAQVVVPLQGGPPSVETSFFLSYSQAAGLAPVSGGALAPNVMLIKSNVIGGQLNGDCSLITLK